MFSGNEVAKAFSFDKTKCSYLVNYGIALYFLELLKNQLVELKHFVALFDESHKKKLRSRDNWTLVSDFGITLRTLPPLDITVLSF